MSDPSLIPDSGSVPGQIVVRETACKAILNPTSLGDYSINCYTGCQHGCVYCYARFMQRFHPHAEPWGQFVDVKINAVEALKRQLRRTKPGEVFVSSACDAWQPLEAHYGLSRRCCQLLLEYGFRLHVLTKSALVLRDLDVLAGGDVTLGVTITTLQEPLRTLWELHAAPVAERWRVLEAGRRAGLETAVMFGPLLPVLSDGQESLNAMFQRAAAVGVQRVWVDALNPRPRVWPSVARLLAQRFPHLRETYRRILFHPATRSAYLADLRQRATQAAKQSGLGDRVVICF